MADRAIELTPDQYRALLILAHIGEWVINADRREGVVRQEFVDVLTHLCAQAERFGAQAWVERNPDDGKMIPSLDLERVAMPFLEEYDNNTFWDELIMRLAERDVIRQIGADRFALMDEEERAALLEPERERYHAEFMTNGIDNITIVNRNIN